MKKSKNITSTTLTPSISSEKIDKKYTQSQVINIFIELKDEKKLKMFFDEKLELNDWEKAIDEVMDLVEKSYSEKQEDELMNKLNELPKSRTNEYFVLIDEETKGLKFTNFEKSLNDRISKNQD